LKNKNALFLQYINLYNWRQYDLVSRLYFIIIFVLILSCMFSQKPRIQAYCVNELKSRTKKHNQ